jgi:hypothetical protein
MSQTNGRKFSSIQFCLSIVAVLPARIEAESRNSFISRSVLAKDQHGQIQVYTEREFGPIAWFHRPPSKTEIRTATIE